MNRQLVAAALLAAILGFNAAGGQPATIDFGPFAVMADFHDGRDSANLAGTGSNFFFGYVGDYGRWLRDRVCDPNGIRFLGDASSWVGMCDTTVDWQSKVNSLVGQWSGCWKGHAAWGLLVGAENKAVYHPQYYPQTQYVCKKIHAEDPSFRTMGQGGINETPNGNYVHFPEIFDECPDLDVLAFSHYWFEGDTPFSDQGALQKFADYSARCNQKLRHPHNLRRRRPMEWYAIIQAHQEYRVAPNWPQVPESLRGRSYRVYRRPTAEEIRCQAFLSLAWGARGIMYYVYHSDTVLVPSAAAPGLPARARLGPDPADAFHYMYYRNIRNIGLVDGTRDRYPFDRSHHPEDTTFDAVRRLNADLKIMGPVLRSLRWDSAASITPGRPFSGMGFVRAIGDGGNRRPFSSLSFELATFTDRAGAGYYLLVNRQCLPADTCRIAVTLGGRYRGKTIRVIDQLTKTVQPVSAGRTVMATIAPGDGRLFKVETP